MDTPSGDCETEAIPLDQQIDVASDRVKPSSGGSMGAELSDSGADLTNRWIVQRSPCPWVTRSRPAFSEPSAGECG